MKALFLREYNHLVYQDVPEPEIGPEEVLVAVPARILHRLPESASFPELAP